MPGATRSLLFVPGARPAIFEKAMGSGADIVCVDLEDAVPPSGKDAARPDGVAWLAGAAAGDACTRALRINGLKTVAGLRDLAAVADAAPAAGLVVMPKVDEAAEVRIVDAALTEAGSDAGLVVLIESVDGLENVQEIVAASSRVKLAMFGAVDLSAELGCDNAPGPLAYARARVVHAARRAGVPAMDVPSLNFRDLDAVAAEAEAARAMGYSGKAAIHPTNVGAVNGVFTPTPEQVAQARKVIAAYEASETGLVVIDGKLIEAPVIRAMRARMEAAEAAGVAPNQAEAGE
ncbi:citrate lyase subunit beta / citryl-CoA lyase/(S)-citramalyl-CoA lyase [Albimonas donghaensis]|uniref:Citrate lyase subunit beta / citryl-CoA lyase/(S)-citramalyl-CoA lyase n=1 Tax=Albimonas donghaensis TaxID=356660 RepID=A0A1H3BP50_9RHOB|nr:CoA ester lyase [Albimonas donghaensis]SDX43491.1 citrate lyase subunit beta / citryl-CoA lyase/(S)-citramalyl-CoA lyase [Albimonas donghaensis]